MQFSAALLATAASMAAAQQFGIIAIRSGSDIQNSAVYSNGEKLVIGGPYQSTDYEVKDMLLLANGKPVEFGNGANIVDSEGAGTRDIEVNGRDYVYVPNFQWTACPAPEGSAFVYTVETSNVCGEAGIPFAARAMFKDGEAPAAPVSTEAAPVETPAITEAPVPVPTGGAVVTANSTIVLTITDCGEGVECTTKPNQAQPTQVEENPEQANGASALGLSAGLAGIAAVAMLL